MEIQRPYGNVLTSKTLPATAIPSGTCGWVSFDVPDYDLVPEEIYWIVLYYNGGAEYIWCGARGNPYTRGESSFTPDWDYCFRTYTGKGKGKDLGCVETSQNNPLLQIFFESYPNLFPILQHLLKL